MPHYSNYGGTRFSAQPADELTGTFNALNETTNVRPTKGESISIVHPAFKTGYDTGPIGSPVELNSLDIGPVNKTADKGWWTVDGADFRDSELDALNETTNFDPKILGPISGNGVFKPQDIDTKGSVIWGDNHFMPDRGGDAITGDGRPMNVWTNGSATSFEDRVFYGIDPDIQRPTHPNDNIGTNSDSYFGDEIHFFTPVASQNGTATFAGSFNLEKGDLPHEGEIFQPARGMNSFGESLNPVSELGGTAGPGATSFMTGRENFDVVAHGVMAGKLNFDVVVH